MGRPSDARGRLVPLSVPMHTPQLALIRSLRSQADRISKRIQTLVKLEEHLNMLPEEPRWDALVPIPSSSSLAYTRGTITNTNTVMVHFDTSEDSANGLDGAGESATANGGYWVQYSAKQARGVARRRQARLALKLDSLKAAISEAEGAVSSEMGFHGGRVNQNYELLNEEGLPFVEIQEFEGDEEEIPVASTSSKQLEVQSENFTTPPPKTAVKVQPEESDAARGYHDLPARKAKKSVSFAQENDYEPPPKVADTDDADLPVIASKEAAASAGLTKDNVAQTTERQRTANPLSSSFADLTIKPSVVVKDATKPPPALTAAERSANKKSRYDVAAEFDGAQPKKVDLSAYLPRQLRGTPIAASFKGKTRAVDQDSASTSANQFEAGSDAEGQDHLSQDDLEDSEDSDYLEDDDFGYDSDDDNTHIDDLLAMREAAMEYHAKRHALGAGAGTGPLGGAGRPDEYDEPGLTEYDKGGLPIVETYEDDPNGNRRPSKFRKSRLQTAQMVIPEIKPGDVKVEETILPGDSLGPYEDEETAEAGEHGTNDFRGMSKEEIETFLRYVKALETGEELQDLRVVSASDAPPTVASPLPMDQKKPPAIKETIQRQEVVPIGADVVEKKVQEQPASQPEKPIAEQGDPPKRVSRFRAARSGNA